jgi:hypothetical protein
MKVNSDDDCFSSSEIALAQLPDEQIMIPPIEQFTYRNFRVGIYPKTTRAEYMALAWYAENKDKPVHGCFDRDFEAVIVKMKHHIDILLDVIKEENLKVIAHSSYN